MSGLTFLSWVRAGPGLDAAPEDPLTGALPAQGALTVGVRLNERAPLALPAHLYGPGDVTGLDPRQVIRTDPAPGAGAAEPTFFPLVEFDRPDLPWLLTPARARDGERLRPWLVLVVVEAATARVGPEPQAVLPVLRCPRAELPDLDESWAWAHAQLVTTGALDEATLTDLLTGPPEASLSRLVCPRRLAPGTAYLAAVVPAFEAGRKRGLGLPLDPADEEELAPAWAAGPGGDQAVLPVYHHWRFATGPEGDFESLVRRLRARPVPETLGLRPMDVSHPAPPPFPALDPADPGAVVGMEGALRGPATVPTPWTAAAASAFAGALAPLLGRRPGRLGPPLYGGGHAGADDVAAAPRWARDLNLDPRHRAAAAFGAEVVRRNQEALMASAWSQAAAVARANDALRQGQLARTAATGAYRRLVGTARAAGGRLLQVSAPAHAALEATDALVANREVQASLSPAFRRLTRPGGPLARRSDPGGAMETAAARLASRQLTVNPALAPAPGMVALEALTGGDRVRDLTAARVKARWWETDPTQPGEVPAPAAPRVLGVGAVMPNRVFMVAEDGRLLSRVDSPAAWHDHGWPPGTTATGQPAAVRDLHAFVRTGDGRLCSLQWDGDRWVWQDHGRPNGMAVTGRPLGLARDSKPVGGGLVRTGNYQSVFVCAADGHLWELSGFESSWRWTDRGTPPGTTAVGAPGAPGPWELLVHAGDGRVFRFYEEGNGWTWADFGRPGVAADPAVPPLGSGGIVFVRTTNGQIQIRYVVIGMGWWVALAAPEPITNVLGFGNGLWVVSEPSGRLMRWYTPPGTTENAWDVHESRPGLRPWGVLRGGVPWVAADGRLLVREGSPGAWSWRDHGLPEPGGTGEPAAAPPRRPQWRGQLGFMGNLVVAAVEGGPSPNLASLVAGQDLGFEGEVRGGWRSISAPVSVRNDDTQGAGVAVTRLGRAGDTDPDLVLFWVAGSAQGNFGYWRVGGSVMPSGDVVGWDDTVRQMPTPMSTLFGSSGALTASYPVLGADLALADLDGDDRPEMVVAYVSGIPDRPKVFYRIGWRLDPSGAVAGGWTESIEVPWPGRGPGALPVTGVGVAVADVDGDLRPELVVLLVEQTPAGARAGYMIGRRLNARGRVVGDWSGPHPVGDGLLGPAAQGASIALVDFSGSQSPDLVVLHVEPGAAGTRTWYRVGFDLQSSGAARRWSEPREVAANWGAGSQGAAVFVADFDNALLARKRQFAADFRAAATPHQQLLERGQALARADDEAAVSLEQVAAGVRAALDPERSVTARVTGSVRGVDFAGLPARADPLNPLLVAPTFPQPMFEPLAELSQDLVLPGVEGVPADTVTLLRANPRFIESYLIGLNHELAREMLWREFPGDRRATFFRQFWDPRIGDAAAGPLTDIPALAGWDPDLHLGGHATAVGGPDMVVLLVRGEVLRRYPAATVFAQRAAWGAPDPEPRQLGADRLLPQFQGQLPPDLVFFGFPLTVAQARGADGDPGWFFVLAESAVAPRFGLDEPTGAFARPPAHWRQLDWAALAPDQAGLAVLTHAPVAGAAFVVPPAESVERPAGPGTGSPLLTWPRNSAHLAHITLQPSVQFAVHATDMLPEPVPSPVRLTGVSPAVAYQAQVVDVTLTGQALGDVVVADFGPDIRAEVLSAEATTLRVRLSVGSLAVPGPRPFRVATPDWAAASDEAGLSFTVTPLYSGLTAAPRALWAPGPARVEVVEPADDVLAVPPRSILVSFSKEIRWETLTPETFVLLDDEGRPLGPATVEPYPFAPEPGTVSRATLVVAGAERALAGRPRPLTLTVRLVGTGPRPVLDVDGLPLDGDFTHTVTVVGGVEADADGGEVAGA